jgi:hypothetical protein
MFKKLLTFPSFLSGETDFSNAGAAAGVAAVAIFYRLKINFHKIKATLNENQLQYIRQL